MTKRSGKNIKLLEGLKVGDSITVPQAVTDAAITKATAGRFYTTAQRLGMKVTFKSEKGAVRITRVA